MPCYRSPTYTSVGEQIFERFQADTGLANCPSVSVFDHHGVVDKMLEEEAVRVGTALDHLDHHCSFLLSYSSRRSHYRQLAFDQNHAYFPMIAQLDGFIFTDLRRNDSPRVEVYQDDWMISYDDCGRDKCARIGVKGDKGQVVELFNKPTLIFDDHLDNVTQVLQVQRANAGCIVRFKPESSGEIVDAMRSWRIAGQPSWRCQVSNNADNWHEMSKQFRDRIMGF